MSRNLGNKDEQKSFCQNKGSVYRHRKGKKGFVQPSSPGHYGEAHGFLGPNHIKHCYMDV